MIATKRTAAEQQTLLCYLRKTYEYDPENGAIRNKKTGVLRKGLRSPGNRYLLVTIYFDSKIISLIYHRVIWALCNGRWPKDVIDHIDGDRYNNRIENLRECTQSVNRRNTLMNWNPNPNTHVPGVCFDKNGFSKHINRKNWRFSTAYNAFFIGTLCGHIYRPD